MTEKMFITIIIFVGGTLLTAARRYNNKDTNAGIGIVGWTIFIIFLMWV